MKPDLEAIRARREAEASTRLAMGYFPSAAEQDADALLQYVDSLRAAAGKVTCETCRGTGIERTLVTACPDCTDLRTLLGEKP
jgi:hypothetical protein